MHTWAVVLGEKVSRVDLSVDLSLELPEVNIKGGEVVSYARSKDVYYIRHFRGLKRRLVTFW